MKRDIAFANMSVERALSLYDAADALTAADESAILKRADELLAEKIADVDTFKEFQSGMPSATSDEQVHRALMNLDRACDGDEIARNAILSALHQVQKVYKTWCESTYRDECMGEAENELFAGEA